MRGAAGAAEREWPETDLDEPVRDAMQDLVEYDISGSQAQILAILMGLRDLERELASSSFKSLLADAARALHAERSRRRGYMFRLPDELLEDDEDAAGYLKNVVKDAAMTRLYGSKPKEIARSSSAIPASTALAWTTRRTSRRC